MKFNIERITEIIELTRHLAVGLRNLDFTNNFRSQEETVTITAGSELEIRNKLKFIPTKYIIVNQQGNGVISKESDWSATSLYLTNNGIVDVTVDVIFLK